MRKHQEERPQQVRSHSDHSLDGEMNENFASTGGEYVYMSVSLFEIREGEINRQSVNRLEELISISVCKLPKQMKIPNKKVSRSLRPNTSCHCRMITTTVIADRALRIDAVDRVNE